MQNAAWALSLMSVPALILGCVLTITTVEGDITKQQVDAVVNAANTAMRGGGGVDGAIHRAGGSAIRCDCVSRFPDGLATGDAGWTTGGDLPAQWVIHTVGPNYNAGQRDRSLLESCYRRSLEVADQLGARTVAFPLISTGIFGWPRQDAISAAIESIAGANTRVDEVRLVAFDAEMHEEVLAKLASWTPLRILQGVQLLHRRGYHRLRILPGLSPSGMYWRVAIANVDNLSNNAPVVDPDSALQYTTGQFTEFAGGEVTVTSTPESVAELILNALPEIVPSQDDPAYASWFAELVRLCERSMSVPVAYADYFDSSKGWEIGNDIRYANPPEVPTVAPTIPAPTQQLHDVNQGGASSLSPAVQATNALTARWCGRLGAEDSSSPARDCGRSWRCWRPLPTRKRRPTWRQRWDAPSNRQPRTRWRCSTSSAQECRPPPPWDSGRAGTLSYITSGRPSCPMG